MFCFPPLARCFALDAFRLGLVHAGLYTERNGGKETLSSDDRHVLLATCFKTCFICRLSGFYMFLYGFYMIRMLCLFHYFVYVTASHIGQTFTQLPTEPPAHPITHRPQTLYVLFCFYMLFICCFYVFICFKYVLYVFLYVFICVLYVFSMSLYVFICF